METLTLVSHRSCTRIRLGTTHPTEFIDITDRLKAAVAQAGVRSGIVNIQTLHTTTAVVVNEREPLLLEDFADLLQGLAPSSVRYRHDDTSARTANLSADERANGHAHCRALLLSPSIGLNVVDGRLVLGRWQRVFFVELDGPRQREVSVVVIGERGR